MGIVVEPDADDVAEADRARVARERYDTGRAT